ncbi:P-loop containing nucleoside triphosphate hydrolase protein, partial [Neohortaea acidophila]
MTTATPMPPKHIWVITGPAGCGKTSVAEALHATFNMPYLEGDTFHSPANVQKMANGEPLTDADRWDWLITLREAAVAALLSSPSSPSTTNGTNSSSTTASANNVVVTCSALKRKYRDVLRIAAYPYTQQQQHTPPIRVHFIFLGTSEAILMDRVRARQNHYMKDYMVHSQVESLEAPMEDERDVLSVDASGTSVEVKRLAEGVVRGVLERE